MSDSGLVINPEWPYIGASPDGLVKCDCCSKHTLGNKCPYSYCTETIISASTNVNFRLKKDDNGDLYLDPEPEDAYYFQVRTQMFCLGHSVL